MKDHLFKAGNKGKPKGAISKTAKYIRDFLADVMLDNLPQLQADLDKMKPRDKWAILKGLSDKFLPDLTHTDIEANVNGQVKFVVEYVDSNIQHLQSIESTNDTLIEEAQFEQLDQSISLVHVSPGIEPILKSS
ncbi:hypothetical protein [Chitinophaga sancti]|uniref:Uncharacterized protein n=1 Tax=Chitinophaga sancti TaxID=1004 RepID=A0A1K1T340_9BACT|nr:hypothetical protein [Chitinophaga sancti]WQD61434.1 hypothetical protein U0033_26515 [Chitinophaga sancti]WQD61770.1 hypothetical protein U0033_28210 [Chitinophaga sancti]WQG92661.1 hypothetical protein SR876_14175 [Chitinophaga sancti]WQG93013.1 hypothetical protein SR876_15945 [Chitinophaga sancti]SFW90992.1 hypothetical protein SAMN05661012_06711 [Chitinophaga sancti]